MTYSIDSRTINTGDIYIPVRGQNFDGHQFITDVLYKGASQVLDVDLLQYAKYYRENKISATIIGVTGSAGKTTVKDMLYEVLKSRYRVYKTLENQNNEIGVPLTLLNAPMDVDFIIIEMAMRKRGEIKQLTQIAQPDHVLITNIGSTHIEFLKTKRNIALAKAEIFNFKKNTEKKHTCVINKTTNYSDLVASIARKNGFQVTLINEIDILKSNIQLIVNLAETLGIPENISRPILTSFTHQSAHRQEIVKIGKATIIDDTYNANPESMKYAINKLILDFPEKNHGVILGEMKELGVKESQEHQQLIEDVISNPSIHFAIFYGSTYKKFEKTHHKCYYFQREADIISQLGKINTDNSAILVKGSRSLHMETIISSMKTHYAN